jgi:hypothetical protein
LILMKQLLALKSMRVRTFFKSRRGIFIANVRELQGHKGMHDQRSGKSVSDNKYEGIEFSEGQGV